jgi:DUF438 domain-containing protein
LNRSGIDISEEVNNCFEELLHKMSSGKDSNITLAHFGEFSQDLVNSISEGVENKLLEEGVKKSVIKKMFSILIEGLQNIRIHGEKYQGKSQHGHVIISKNKLGFALSFGNYVLNKNIERLTNHLNELNEKDDSEIKERYLEVLGNGIISDKGGAGLGFITIAMKAKSKLNYNFTAIDEELKYFNFEVQLNE